MRIKCNVIEAKANWGKNHTREKSHPKYFRSKLSFAVLFLLCQVMEGRGDTIIEEIDCFVLAASLQIEHQMGQCRTIYDVLDSTMTYFCNFLVGPMVRENVGIQ